MSTRVDFYLLDHAAPEPVARYACRLLGKAYAAGLRTYVYAASQDQALALDDMLWTFRDSQFIPHALATSAAASNPLTKICIGHEAHQDKGFDLLLNLNAEAQPESNGYARVADIVSADDAHKQAARERYRRWRDLGAELNLHRIALH